MKFNLEEYKIYLRPGNTDMRKHSSSLSMFVCTNMKLNPLEKSIFVFCSKGRKTIKAIFWDNNGFWECTKRLEYVGTFKWPDNNSEALQVSVDDIIRVLRGEDIFRKLPNLTPLKVS